MIAPSIKKLSPVGKTQESIRPSPKAAAPLGAFPRDFLIKKAAFPFPLQSQYTKKRQIV